MKKYEPTFERVLVRMKPQQGISAGGLYLPGQQSSCEGVIEACGPGARADGFQPGDHVLLDRLEMKGSISSQEPELVCIKDEHILLVIRDEDEPSTGN
jgi:co-chaperonin GroES (HSP10)